jgi:hypothetical protein
MANRKEISELIDELNSWLPNYDARSDNDYPVLLFRILASLPGGERLEDMGYEPFNLAWQEADQLGRVLMAVQGKWEVEELVEGLLQEEPEEELDEARRRRPRTQKRAVKSVKAARGPRGLRRGR